MTLNAPELEEELQRAAEEDERRPDGGGGTSQDRLAHFLQHVVQPVGAGLLAGLDVAHGQVHLRCDSLVTLRVRK